MTDLVVIGLGYVGLPVAREAVRAGLRVVGLDVDPAVVDGLREGSSRIDDVPDTDVAEMVGKGFLATIDPGCLDVADAVVICVPTPLGDDQSPDLGPVLEASRTVAEHVHRGMLVVLESTTYPGTTDEVVRPLLEKMSGLQAGVDFHLAYSPERIDPGNPTWSLRNTPKVIGGLTEACRDRAAKLYGSFIDEIVEAAGTREAEMAKLLENTYRHVNIALLNEMSVFCHELGVDLWEAIRLASSKPFGFTPFYPGPGVGGHCIPVDPSYLSYKVRTLGYPFRFVELAKEINDRMPLYVANRIAWTLNAVSKPVRGSRILLLGVTYKADVADERESPAQPLGARLLELGAALSYHDPFVETWRVASRRLERVGDVEVEAASADLVVVLQHHSVYDLERISRRAQLVLDTRGQLRGENVERL